MMSDKTLTISDFQKLFIQDVKSSKRGKTIQRNDKVIIRLYDENNLKFKDWIFSKQNFQLYISPLFNKN